MNFENIFESFNQAKVLVIGDVMIDAYLWGKVERISPEAPVPILSFNKEEFRLGGAANVALNIQALGAEPILCSVIGEGPHSDIFHELLLDHNLASEGIVVDNNRITTVKTRIISGSQQMLRIDKEEESPLNETIEEQFINNTIEVIKQKNINGIIFEDYDKGVITQKVIKSITEYANNNDIPIFVDPKRVNFKHYKNVTLFKPNFKEFCEGVDIRVEKTDTKAINWGVRFLHSSQKIEYIMVTLAEEGMFVSDNKKHVVIPVKKRKIVDVSGAGDTVISVSSLFYIAGLTMKQSAKIGNMAAGQVCSQVGVVPVNKSLLLEEIIESNIKPEPRI